MSEKLIALPQLETFYADFKNDISTYGQDNLIPFPYYQSTFSFPNLSVTIEVDGGIKIVGSVDTNVNIILSQRNFTNLSLYKGTPYTLSGLSVNDWNNKSLRLWLVDKDSNLLLRTDVKDKNTFIADKDYNLCGMFLMLVKDVMYNETIYPMLNTGTIEFPYKPYNTSGISLRQDVDTINNSGKFMVGSVRLTSANYESLGIHSLNDCPNNVVFGIDTSITKDMIDGLPIYNKYATLMVYDYNITGHGFKTAIYSTTNSTNTYIPNIYMAYQRLGESWTSWVLLNGNLPHSELANLKGKNVVITGDSIVAGVGSSDYSTEGGRLLATITNPTTHESIDYYSNDYGVMCWGNKFRNYLNENYGCHCVNNAIGGWMWQLLYQFRETMIPPETDIVIICLGINNRKYPDLLMPNFALVKNYCDQHNIKMIVLTSIASTDDWAEAKIDYHEVNNLLQTACADNLIPVYNLQSELNHYLYEHNLNLDDLLVDKLHPGDALYDIMFHLVCKLLGV